MIFKKDSPKPSTYRTPVGECLKAAVGYLRARLQIDRGQLGAVLAELLYGNVADLLALGQIEMLDVMAVVGKGTDRVAADRLAAPQSQILQKAATAL